MISPVNFTGIKNAGYARAYTQLDGNNSTRTVINMQLTDDENKDLSEYKKLIKENPSLENKVNKDFLNIEMETIDIGETFLTRAKMNGEIITPVPEQMPLLNFMSNIVKRIANFKAKDFKSDEDFHYTNEAKLGLFYNVPLEYFMDGSAGRLDLLEGTDLAKKFDLYMNDPNIELSEEDEEKLFDAEDGICEVLHNPQYVKNGALYMGAVLKGYNNIKTYS